MLLERPEHRPQNDDDGQGDDRPDDIGDHHVEVAAFRVGESEFVDLSSGAARQIGQTPTQIHPQLEKLIAGFEKNAPFAGSCAEIGCISQALRQVVNPTGGTISTAVIRKAGNALHGTPYTPCITCQQVLEHYGITFVP